MKTKGTCCFSCNTQAQKNDVKSILSTWYMDVPFIFHFNMTGFECLLWNSLQIGPSKIWFDYTIRPKVCLVSLLSKQH
jgi:hypothetical protein